MGLGHSSARKTTLVIPFHDMKSWRDHFEESRKANKLMVVEFSASWCGVSRRMEPILNELSERFRDVEFVKMDVDELNDLAGEFGIDSVPTFVFMKYGKERERVVGRHRDKLEKFIEKHRF